MLIVIELNKTGTAEDAATARETENWARSEHIISNIPWTKINWVPVDTSVALIWIKGP